MSEDSEIGADWRNRSPLSGTDLADFLALQQVCGCPDSGVDQVGDRYVENQNQRPVLPFLADAMAVLFEVGQITIGEPGLGEVRPLLVTANGRARYEDLCDRQGIPPYPSCGDRQGKPAYSCRSNRHDTRPSSGNAAVSWVFDPEDGFAHVLAETTGGQPGMLVTMCGRTLPGESTSRFSVPPSLVICQAYGPFARMERPPPMFPTPTHY